jgi:2-oxoglutarate dehydrogenase E2 component (dihydrolipoamide succinyltransferase)
MWGVLNTFATPIILQPQVEYAAVIKTSCSGGTKEGDFMARNMMYGVSTYDHRLIDGEIGGLFAEAVHMHLKNMDLKSLF